MKKLLYVLILLSIISIPMLAQTTKFHAYEVVIVNNETKQELSNTLDETIRLTDYSLSITTGARWDFVGTTVQENSTTLYIMADDNNGIRCRVWISTKDGTSWLIYIQYSDYTVFYYCTII